MTGIPDMDLCNLWTIMPGIYYTRHTFNTHTLTAIGVINIAGDITIRTIFHKHYRPDSFLQQSRRLHICVYIGNLAIFYINIYINLCYTILL